MGDNITKEELNNMTPAEIKALKQQKIEALWNMTPAEIQNLREQKRLALENMTLAELQKNSQNRYLRGHHKGSQRLAGYSGHFGFGAGPKFYSERTGCSMSGFAGLHGSTWMLLVDNATKNNLQNMTLAQIDTLRQQKKQELENMTLAEIQDLRVKKWQEMQNMTLAEIKDQRKQMGGMEWTFHETRSHCRLRFPG